MGYQRHVLPCQISRDQRCKEEASVKLIQCRNQLHSCALIDQIGVVFISTSSLIIICIITTINFITKRLKHGNRQRLSPSFFLSLLKNPNPRPIRLSENYLERLVFFYAILIFIFAILKYYIVQ